jgi:MFS family permease
MLAGLGNSPFHPVDFTILNKRVSPARLGHAFSVHGISGNLGWAAAPVFLGGITSATGSWRVATAAAGVWALFVVMLLWWQRSALDDRSTAALGVKPTTGTAVRDEHALAFLKLPSVWLCFSFFFWSTCAMSAVQSFAGPALQQLYGLPLGWASLVVTGYMLFSAAGMVVGGFLAAGTQRLERLIAVCLVGAAALLSLAGAGFVGGYGAALLAALAGAGTGLAGPSRDMLIKRAAPPGATGRVYGTVYSGLDLGFAPAAPVFGALLDRQHPALVFHGAAFTLLMGVVSASFVGLRLARGSHAAAKVAA